MVYFECHDTYGANIYFCKNVIFVGFYHKSVSIALLHNTTITDTDYYGL